MLGAQPSPIPIQLANVVTPCQANHVPTSSNLIVLSSSPVLPIMPAVQAEISADAVMQSGIYNTIPSQTSIPVSPNTQYIQGHDRYSSNQNGAYYSQAQCPLTEQVCKIYVLIYYFIHAMVAKL